MYFMVFTLQIGTNVYSCYDYNILYNKSQCFKTAGKSKGDYSSQKKHSKLHDIKKDSCYNTFLD